MVLIMMVVGSFMPSKPSIIIDIDCRLSFTVLDPHPANNSISMFSLISQRRVAESEPEISWNSEWHFCHWNYGNAAFTPISIRWAWCVVAYRVEVVPRICMVIISEYFGFTPQVDILWDRYRTFIPLSCSRLPISQFLRNLHTWLVSRSRWRFPTSLQCHVCNSILVSSNYATIFKLYLKNRLYISASLFFC